MQFTCLHLSLFDIFMADLSLPFAGGAGRSLRGTAGLFRSLREQARLNEVPSLLEDGVDVDEAGEVFSAGLFGDDFGSFLKEPPPVDSSAERKRANKRFKNLNFDSVQAGRNTKTHFKQNLDKWSV